MFLFAILISLLYGGLCLYLGRGLYRCCLFPLPRLKRRWFALAVLPLFLILPLSLLPLGSWMETLSAYWMGIFLYLFLFFLLFDLLRLLFLPWGGRRPLVRFCAGVLAVLATAGVSVYGFGHARDLQVVTHEISLPHRDLNEPLRVVLLTDLHLGAVGSEERLAEIVDAVNAQDPHVICIAGDLIDTDFHSIKDPDAAARELRRLQSVHGVYACLGNHDSGKTFSEMLQFFALSNITVLTDTHTVVDNRFVLVGRLDPSPIGGNGYTRGDTASLEASLPDLNLPVIVMDHNPREVDAYTSAVDLILSGHTHRGQVFPGALITNAMYPVDYGYYQKNADSPHVIVSSGVGTWGLPMRVGSDSEIVCVVLG